MISEQLKSELGRQRAEQLKSELGRQRDHAQALITAVLETDIAQAVRLHLESQGLKVRAEVPVTLPDHGQVFADLVACKTDETGEWFTVVECKKRFDATLFNQAMRWMEAAQYICIAHVPQKHLTAAHHSRNSRLLHLGVGIFSFIDERAVVRREPVWLGRGPDFDILSAAFHSHTGECDPLSGSAGVKRMTGARTQWEPLRKYLTEICYGNGQIVTAFWKTIQHECKEMRKHTAAQVRKAIDKGECPGIAYQGNSITEFYATDPARANP